MNRYAFSIIKKNKDGKRVLSSTMYPKIPFRNGDRFVYPIEGDRLETIAKRYYDDTTLWWIIAKANEIRDGSYALNPAKQIRVPRNISSIISDFERLNSQ